MNEDTVFDAWSPLDYKINAPGARPASMPSWIGDHARRLAAYQVLQTYVDNNARTWLEPPDANDITAGRNPDDHREYGDAGLIVKTILAGVLGNEQRVTVTGAELKGRENEAAQIASENAPTAAEIDRAYDIQVWMRQWAKDQRWGLKLIQSERNAISLGDTVFLVQFDGVKDAVTVETLNPGFYFPVLSDDPTSDFPTKVHLAWELTPDPDQPGLVRIRRITYELIDDPQTEPLHSYSYAPTVFTRTRCLVSDGVWTIDATNQTVNDLTEAKVKWNKNSDGVVIRSLDAGVDFIPIVHMPNTVAEEDHYGRSSLAEILQVLDDIAAADTDLNAASATTGTPPLALGGQNTSGNEIRTYGPGTVFDVGDGSLTQLDTSRSLDALLKYTRQLLERMAINSRVAEAAIGRINAASVPSGIALALSFAPMEQLVREMRAVRDDKYPLLFKFIARYAMEADLIAVGELPEIRVEFGSFLPTDRKTVVDEVVSLFTANAISSQTAVMMLMAAGLPIDDAALEVQRLEKVRADNLKKANPTPGNPNPQQNPAAQPNG